MMGVSEGYECANCLKAIDYDDYAAEWFHIDSEKHVCNPDDSPNTVAEEKRR